MLQRDRTGPFGRGARTGRGFGFCSGFSDRGLETPRFGRGFGRGYGYNTSYSGTTEKEELKNHIAQLEEELKQAKNELKKL